MFRQSASGKYWNWEKMFCPENTIVGFHDTLFHNVFTSISFLFSLMLSIKLKKTRE